LLTTHSNCCKVGDLQRDEIGHRHPSGNEWRFTGELQDSRVARGMYYLRARYYDPALGRFIGRDPFPGFAGGPQSHNRYIYVANNPVKLVDPYGLCGLNSWGDFGDCFKEGAEKAGEGIQWIGEQAKDLLASSYYDLNITIIVPVPVGPIILPVALSLGVQRDKEGGGHPYIAGGMGFPPGGGVSFSTGPKQDVSQGGYCSGQASLPIYGIVTAALQGGIGGLFGSGPSWFHEEGLGVGRPGGAATCGYVW
jgi:RHS repeat-associated protein